MNLVTIKFKENKEDREQVARLQRFYRAIFSESRGSFHMTDTHFSFETDRSIDEIKQILRGENIEPGIFESIK